MLLTPSDARAFRSFATNLAGSEAADSGATADALSALAGRTPRLRASILVLRDLARQGWRIRVRRSTVEVAKPDREVATVAEKDRVRTQLNVERDEQLRAPAVRAFVKSMEVRRVHRGKAVSIFSLMRDGTDLAQHLREVTAITDPHARERALGHVVQPYLQFVSDGATCEWTGYPLVDIWRYFRHTWASPYRSTPGRSMMVIVRDAAIEPHPVIGIAALSSSAVQIGARDKWIGWGSDELLHEMATVPTVAAAKWLLDVVNGAMDEVFVDDFLEEAIISRQELRLPRPETIESLEREATAHRKLHLKFVSSAEHKRERPFEVDDSESWRRAARSHLFRSKRAELLARLLRARRALAKAKRLTAAALADLVSTGEGRRTVRAIIKRAKAETVGTAMADITVCGAVAPYNALLG
jgi:hypothetical protein